MSVITNLVSNVTDAITGGSTSQSGLDDFLSKFNNPQKHVETLDPLGTFDVYFRFFPTSSPVPGAKTQDTASRILAALGNAASTAIDNALDSVTGGLYSSFKNGSSQSVIEQRDAFKPGGDKSFMEYLVKANMIQDDVSQPVDLSLGLYVQSITVPNLQSNGGSQQTSFGDFPTMGGYVGANGSLNMTIVNTKAALHERIFLPWLRETTYPYWSYKTQPYTTATITVDFTKHNDVKYVFCGCRPTEIKTLQATQQSDSGNLTRDVTFAYDFMFVTSDLTTYDSAKNKLLDSLGSIGSGIAKTLNMG